MLSKFDFIDALNRAKFIFVFKYSFMSHLISSILNKLNIKLTFRYNVDFSLQISTLVPSMKI